MKMNYEHPYILICRIAKKVFLLNLIVLALLFSASLDMKEALSFSYHWSMNENELEAFIKNGQLDLQKASSIYYEGRYYPYYTVLLENSPSEVIHQVRNKQTKTIPMSALPEDFTSVSEKAIDRIDISVFKDHVQMQEIPGIGTLIEILPFLPDENGYLTCLLEADIQLYSSGTKPLTKSDLVKDKNFLAKSATLKHYIASEYCVIYLNEAGVYEISGQDLLDKEVDISSIVPEQIKLYRWGEEIPCLVTATNNKGTEVFKENDVVRFYISELKNPYGDYKYNPFTDYDAVVMTWDAGAGRRYVQENSNFSDDENKFDYDMNRKFRSTIHVEQNLKYFPLSRLHEDELSHKYEHEFYSPSIKIGRSISYPFDLWDPVIDSPYNVHFKIRMQGLTYSVDDEMDHQIIVKANDLQVLEDEWEGQTARISDNEGLQYLHSNLKNGENHLQISVRGFSEDSYQDDQVLLDWFEVSYDRYMIAHNNRLKFAPQYGPGTYMFQVRGLTSATDVLILKNGTNWIRDYLVEEENSGDKEKTYSIYFEDKCNGDEEYFVVGPGEEDNNAFGVVAIDSFRYVNTIENEHYNAFSQGDYIIITHKDFYEKSKELAEHKASLGFTPALYQLERVYDEYNHGNESPYAIKNFLKDACANWSIRPEYVILVGDTRTENSVPVIYYQSTGAIGAIIAENWYADVDDDYVLDLALGRLPVSHEDELDSIIAKIKVFDNIQEQAKNYREAVITGPGSVFRTQAHSYINTIVPDYFPTDRLYLYDTHQTGHFDAGIHSTDTLVNFINDGLLTLNYIGHGGGYTWDTNVLPYNDFDRFPTNKPFIVNSLTCFSNTFSNNNAIGEQFIRHPRAAVSVLGSTGYGWINSDYYLFEKLMGRIHEDKMSHGQAFRFAMADYFFSSFGRNASFIDRLDGVTYIKYFRKSFFYQFCILGDPSVAYPKTKETDVNLSPRSLSSGDQIDIVPTDNNITHAQLDIVATKGSDRKYPFMTKIPLEFQGGNAQIDLSDIPPGSPGGIVQMTFWDTENNIYTSSADLAFGSPHVGSLSFYPSQPSLFDSEVKLRLSIDAGTEIDSIKLHVYRKPDLSSYSQVLSMYKIADGVYETQDAFIYSSKDRFQTAVEDSIPASYFYGNYFMPKVYTNGTSISFQLFTLFPDYPSEKDISIVQYEIKDGKSKLVLLNQADTSSHVAIKFVSENLGQTFLDTVLTHDDVGGYYEAGSEKINTFYFDFLPQFGKDKLYIEINALDIEDANPNNDSLTIVTNNHCLSYKNASWQNWDSDTCAINSDIFQQLLIDKTYTGSYAICVELDSAEYDLSDYGAKQSDSHIMRILSDDKTISVVGIAGGKALTQSNMLAYHDGDNNKFYKLWQEKVSGKKKYFLHKPGDYLLAESQDDEAPEIEININAREILEKAYVSERSDFSIILKDNYGINPLDDFRHILLDGEEISNENLLVINSDNIKELGLNFKLEMEPGEHTLQVIAEDLVGNKVESDVYEIIYSGDSQLINYGNFPNPFTTKTSFIYELTEQFDDLSIKIYTISGRKIYTISSEVNITGGLPLHSIGYHEVQWRGKDEFGNKVANGVYFYVIEAKVDGKKIKAKGKIAKLWL
ncbi:MAG: C25 family cysteine peptidase [Candidatus Neomarinimicrobiota bacterium]